MLLTTPPKNKKRPYGDGGSSDDKKKKDVDGCFDTSSGNTSKDEEKQDVINDSPENNEKTDVDGGSSDNKKRPYGDGGFDTSSSNNVIDNKNVIANEVASNELEKQKKEKEELAAKQNEQEKQRLKNEQEDEQNKLAQQKLLDEQEAEVRKAIAKEELLNSLVKTNALVYALIDKGTVPLTLEKNSEGEKICNPYKDEVYVELLSQMLYAQNSSVSIKKLQSFIVDFYKKLNKDLQKPGFCGNHVKTKLEIIFSDNYEVFSNFVGGLPYKLKKNGFCDKLKNEFLPKFNSGPSLSYSISYKHIYSMRGQLKFNSDPSPSDCISYSDIFFLLWPDSENNIYSKELISYYNKYSLYKNNLDKLVKFEFIKNKDESLEVGLLEKLKKIEITFDKDFILKNPKIDLTYILGCNLMAQHLNQINQDYTCFALKEVAKVIKPIGSILAKDLYDEKIIKVLEKVFLLTKADEDYHYLRIDTIAKDINLCIKGDDAISKILNKIIDIISKIDVHTFIYKIEKYDHLRINQFYDNSHNGLYNKDFGICKIDDVNSFLPVAFHEWTPCLFRLVFT